MGSYALDTLLGELGSSLSFPLQCCISLSLYCRDGVKRKGDKIRVDGALGWVTEQHCEPGNQRY